MATEFSMLSIINAALLAQGQFDVSENDGSLEWRTLFRNWPFIVEAELEDGNYNFTKTENLLLSRSGGAFGFDDAYLIPGDTLTVRRVYVKDSDGAKCPIDYITDGARIYCTYPDNSGFEDGIYAETTVVADERVFSANFARGLQLKLEGVIAKAIKEEFNEHTALNEQGEEHFGRARANSSRERTPQPAYKKGPLSRARRYRR